MCPKNDDPLTTGQGYRAIKISIGGTTSLLVGNVGITFNGEVATLDASAAGNTASSCASAFTQLRSVTRATCTITVLDTTVKSAEYVIEFTEWTHIDAENNLLFHNGNPPLSAFTCDISKVTSANTPTCAITDIVASNVVGALVATTQDQLCLWLLNLTIAWLLSLCNRTRVLLEPRCVRLRDRGLHVLRGFQGC